MKRTSRVLAAVVAATALTFTGVHTADAKPAHAGSHAKAEKAAKAKGGKAAAAKDPAAKLARDVARVLSRLDRAVGEKRLAKLSTEDRDAVLANAELDRADIGLAATKSDLRAFRVENYRLAVNILRQAAKAEAAATEAGDTAAGALVTSAVEKARAVRATSPKSDVKAARADLSAALDLLEPEESDLEEGESDDSLLEEGDSESGVDAPDGEDLPMLSEPITELPWTSAV